MFNIILVSDNVYKWHHKLYWYREAYQKDIQRIYTGRNLTTTHGINLLKPTSYTTHQQV
jgi:hypothetical protein